MSSSLPNLKILADGESTARTTSSRSVGNLVERNHHHHFSFSMTSSLQRLRNHPPSTNPTSVHFLDQDDADSGAYSQPLHEAGADDYGKMEVALMGSDEPIAKRKKNASYGSAMHRSIPERLLANLDEGSTTTIAQMWSITTIPWTFFRFLASNDLSLWQYSRSRSVFIPALVAGYPQMHDIEDNPKCDENNSARPVHAYAPSIIVARFAWMIKCLVLLYCLFSVLFMSSAIYQASLRRIRRKELVSVAATISYLDKIPEIQRLGRLMPFQPSPLAFEPNILSARITSGVLGPISACLWAQYDENTFDNLMSWAENWKGPISLLLATTAIPLSPTHQELLERIRVAKSSPVFRLVSLHILHLDAVSAHSPNSYLNVARLFAPTEAVILFPGDILSTFPNSDLLPTVLSSLEATAKSERKLALGTPLLIFNAGENFPASVSPSQLNRLAPLFLPRDHPVWCHEHTLSFGPPRSFAWDECIFQFKLDNLVDLKSINVTQLNIILEDDTPLSGFSKKLQYRLSSDYKREACHMAHKQLVSTHDTRAKTTKRKAKWLDQLCGQWRMKEK